MKLSHRGNGCPRTSQGRRRSNTSRMVRERSSDSLPTGRLSVRQDFWCCLSSSIEPTSTKRQPSEASASRTALRFAEMASISVEHLPPTQAVELLLGYDGVQALRKVDCVVFVVHDLRSSLRRPKEHRAANE